MKACHAVCEIENPVDWTEQKMALFRESCREMAAYHQKHNAEIRHLYQRYGFQPEHIQTEADLAKIPALGVTAMKYYLLTSLPHDQAVLKLTSSGTRGQKTQIWFDQASLDRVQRMMDVYLDQEGFVSDKKQNYLVFNYNPDQAGDLGIAYTEKNQLRFAPVNRVFYAIEKNAAGQWVFEKEKAYRFLKEYEKEGLPVRIFAMPAFLFEFIEFMKEKNLPPLKFHKDSWTLTGGGWKAAEDKKISRADFRNLCYEAFGILTERQRDAYGMAEHCAPYFECKEHRFHIAVYNRILIRDPETMQVLPPGEPGLMELLTPFNAMMPTLAILTTDYGKLHADACKCGWKSPTFEVIGRAGMTKHKGCALTASEIVKR